MGDDPIPPPDPARLGRVTNALMMPVMLGMAVPFLLGHYMGGTPWAIAATVMYGIAAIVVAVRVIKSSTVDHYIRTGNTEGAEGLGAALVAAEVAAVVITDGSPSPQSALGPRQRRVAEVLITTTPPDAPGDGHAGGNGKPGNGKPGNGKPGNGKPAGPGPGDTGPGHV